MGNAGATAVTVRAAGRKGCTENTCPRLTVQPLIDLDWMPLGAPSASLWKVPSVY